MKPDQIDTSWSRRCTVKGLQSAKKQHLSGARLAVGKRGLCLRPVMASRCKIKKKNSSVAWNNEKLARPSIGFGVYSTYTLLFFPNLVFLFACV